MPVLSFQKNARGRRGVVHRQHDDGARVMDNIAPRPHTARFLDLISGDPENRPAIYGSGREDSFFASLFAENFRHIDTIKHGFRLSASAKTWSSGSRMAKAGSRMALLLCCPAWHASLWLRL